MQHILTTFTILFSFFSNTLLAKELSGKVTSIADGDTLTLLVHQASAAPTQHKIRLLGIDAPESQQAFGHARSLKHN
ncbi:thermonuclease family protein [Rubritalea tangerina]|uniref:Thermonuclease family protein n=1 Tax=Rubritalea tangerina TaxID=430798 RepID=A0ABW4Z857_9BACT